MLDSRIVIKNSIILKELYLWDSFIKVTINLQTLWYLIFLPIFIEDFWAVVDSCTSVMVVLTAFIDLEKMINMAKAVGKTMGYLDIDYN